MNFLLFPTSIAVALHAVQTWEWALYSVSGVMLTAGIYLIYLSIYHYFFSEP